MPVNVEELRHLAKSVLSCVLFSLCSSGSIGVLGGFGGFGRLSNLNNTNNSNNSNDITAAVRWASVVVILAALYYLQYQVCVRLWQRKKERRSRGRYRSQYRRTRTAVDPSSNGTGSMGNGLNRLNRESDDADLDSLDTINESESVESMESASQTEFVTGGTDVWAEGASIVSNNVYYPELTMTSVWTYVYGWGLLLFVSVYCLAVVDIPSSCWWVMGMIALSFDELISKGMGKWFVCLIGASLSGSIFAVWSGSLMDNEGNFIGELMFAAKEGIPLFSLLMGVVLPVSVPFIFFSVRSTLRSATQDVSRLCEFALPFMTVLAVCCLVATSGVCGPSQSSVGSVGNVGNVGNVNGVNTEIIQSNSRRGLNHTNYQETTAKFASSYNSKNNNNDSAYLTLLQHTLMFISPIVAFGLIRVLVIAIITRHATEFIAAFILVTSVRFSMTNTTGVWSILALSGAGFAFVFLLFYRSIRGVESG